MVLTYTIKLNISTFKKLTQYQPQFVSKEFSIIIISSLTYYGIKKFGSTSSFSKKGEQHWTQPIIDKIGYK
jgi:hypothetical protein